MNFSKKERMNSMNYRFLRFPGGKAKAVTFSYDDGCRHDIRFSQTITPRGIRCTFNINSGLFGKNDKDWHLTEEEIREHIVDADHEIAVHGRLHMAPGLSRPVDCIQDMLSCRLELEKTYDRIVRGMAYPDSGITNLQNGASYDNIRRYLQDLGIVYSRTLGGDNDSFRLPADWMAWMPTAHHRNPKLMEYARKFLADDPNKEGLYPANRYPRLFYLWGHSFEFHDHDEWDLLDRICDVLAGHEDVWYATNMEIYEYVHAYDSLIFSADGTKVYNPTLMTVWFHTDTKLYSVASGQTLDLE